MFVCKKYPVQLHPNKPVLNFKFKKVRYEQYGTLWVGDTRKFCFDTIPSTFVMVLMSFDTDTEYL